MGTSDEGFTGAGIIRDLLTATSRTQCDAKVLDADLGSGVKKDRCVDLTCMDLAFTAAVKRTSTGFVLPDIDMMLHC